MMVAREMGSFLPGSLHSSPKDAPSWPGLLEAWLALTSVKYHGNLLVLIPLNQRLALTRLRTTGPWALVEAVHQHFFFNFLYLFCFFFGRNIFLRTFIK